MTETQSTTNDDGWSWRWSMMAIDLWRIRSIRCEGKEISCLRSSWTWWFVIEMPVTASARACALDGHGRGTGTCPPPHLLPHLLQYAPAMLVPSRLRPIQAGLSVLELYILLALWNYISASMDSWRM